MYPTNYLVIRLGDIIDVWTHFTLNLSASNEEATMCCVNLNQKLIYLVSNRVPIS